MAASAVRSFSLTEVGSPGALRVLKSTVSLYPDYEDGMAIVVHSVDDPAGQLVSTPGYSLLNLEDGLADCECLYFGTSAELDPASKGCQRVATVPVHTLLNAAAEYETAWDVTVYLTSDYAQLQLLWGVLVELRKLFPDHRKGSFQERTLFLELSSAAQLAHICTFPALAFEYVHVRRVDPVHVTPEMIVHLFRAIGPDEVCFNALDDNSSRIIWVNPKPDDRYTVGGGKVYYTPPTAIEDADRSRLEPLQVPIDTLGFAGPLPDGLVLGVSVTAYQSYYTVPTEANCRGQRFVLAQDVDTSSDYDNLVGSQAQPMDDEF